jgi:hypothetical protein
VDTTLRLTQWNTQNVRSSLELEVASWNESLNTITGTTSRGMFAMFTKDGKAMIQENHSYEEGRHVLDRRAKKRVEALAQLLRQPKERIFRIPRFIDWKDLPMQKLIAFVFEVHPKPEAEPVSLLRLLSSSDIKPELGDKFRLALGLARCIAQLHMVKWVGSSYLLFHRPPDN